LGKIKGGPEGSKAGWKIGEKLGGKKNLRKVEPDGGTGINGENKKGKKGFKSRTRKNHHEKRKRPLLTRGRGQTKQIQNTGGGGGLVETREGGKHSFTEGQGGGLQYRYRAQGVAKISRNNNNTY